MELKKGRRGTRAGRGEYRGREKKAEKVSGSGSRLGWVSGTRTFKRGETKW